MADNRKRRLFAALEAGDVAFVVEEAQRHGLGDNATRRRVWPFLLGIQNKNNYLVEGKSKPPDSATGKVVDVDVPRSMHSYDVTKAFDPDKREAMRSTLKSLIYNSLDLSVDSVTAAASPLPKLHYYQGFHDVVSVFQLVLGPRLGEMCTRRAAFYFLRDAMRKSMVSTMDIIGYIFPLIQLRDRKLFEFLQKSGVSALVTTSWFLTWFAHSVEEFAIVARLYDFFLASPPIMSVYFIAALIMNAREQILKLECDMPSVHVFLQDNVVRAENLEPACKAALVLLHKVKPEKLRKHVAKQGHVAANRSAGKETSDEGALQIFHNTPLVDNYLLIKRKRAATRVRVTVAVVSVLAVVVGMGVAFYTGRFQGIEG